MKNKVIASTDKLKRILKKYPFLKDKIVNYSPKFRKLNNPILFKTVAAVATISDVAVVSKEDLGKLLTFLNNSLVEKGILEEYNFDKNINLKEETKMKPDILDELEFKEIDARVLEGNFLPQIMNSAKTLKPNTGLKLIQSFEPLPLINVLEGIGFEYFTEKERDDKYIIYFYKTNGTKETILYSSVSKTDKDERIPVVLQSATPVLYPIIVKLLESGRIRKTFNIVEAKVWDETEKHLGWIVNGKADISFSAIIAVSKLLKKNIGIELLSVDVWDNFFILTNGFEAKKFADLKEKQIYMPLFKKAPPANVTDYLLKSFGENPDEYNFVFGEPFGRPEEIAAKLVNNEIEAALLREPEASYALASNKNIKQAFSYSELWKKLHPEFTGLPNAGLVVKSELLKNHKEEMDLFITELKNVINWVVENKDEAARKSAGVMGKSFNEILLFLNRVTYQHVPINEVEKDIENYLKIVE